MKVTVNIDCTPAEARQFFGLPDLEPMQTTILQELERRSMAEIDRFSVENMMKLWFSGAPQHSQWAQQMFEIFLQGSRKQPAGGG